MLGLASHWNTHTFHSRPPLTFCTLARYSGIISKRRRTIVTISDDDDVAAAGGSSQAAVVGREGGGDGAGAAAGASASTAIVLISDDDDDDDDDDNRRLQIQELGDIKLARRLQQEADDETKREADAELAAYRQLGASIHLPGGARAGAGAGAGARGGRRATRLPRAPSDGSGAAGGAFRPPRPTTSASMNAGAWAGGGNRSGAGAGAGAATFGSSIIGGIFGRASSVGNQLMNQVMGRDWGDGNGYDSEDDQDYYPSGHGGGGGAGHAGGGHFYNHADADEGVMTYDEMLALDDKVKKKGLSKADIERLTFTQTLKKADLPKLSVDKCVICKVFLSLSPRLQ